MKHIVQLTLMGIPRQIANVNSRHFEVLAEFAVVRAQPD